MAKKKLNERIDELNNLEFSGQDRAVYLAAALKGKSSFLLAAAINHPYNYTAPLSNHQIIETR